MKFKQDDFYEDDDGISIDVVLKSFGDQKVQVICIESWIFDEKLGKDVEFILLNEHYFFQLIESQIQSYSKEAYGVEESTYKLMKIYLFPDIENEFGFLFTWSCDREHGLGVRFLGLNIKEIGKAEIAFL